MLVEKREVAASQSPSPLSSSSSTSTTGSATNLLRRVDGALARGGIARKKLFQY